MPLRSKDSFSNYIWCFLVHVFALSVNLLPFLNDIFSYRRRVGEQNRVQSSSYKRMISLLLVISADIRLCDLHWQFHLTLTHITLRFLHRIVLVNCLGHLAKTMWSSWWPSLLSDQFRNFDFCLANLENLENLIFSVLD